MTNRPSTIPESIDQYRVIRQIGSGGAADTYEVVWEGDDGTEGRGCMKRLHAHCAREPRNRELFAREARIAGHLHHGNLVDILDHKLEAERPYVVFQFIDGVDLRVLRREGGLASGRVVWIGERVAAALSYAHSFRQGEIRGVLHRDIAPGNILVDTEGGVKLADFGLARVQTDVTRSLTMERELSGTVPYLAPEVVRAERVTERSDIYGLGAVLYELAVGAPPFEGTNHYELIRKIGDGERPNTLPLRELAPSFPDGFHTLVESMLAMDPEDRPKSAGDVQLELQACGVGRAERRGLGKLVREVQEQLRESAPVHSVSRASNARTTAKHAASMGKTGKWRRGTLLAAGAAALVPALLMLVPSWGASKTSEPPEPSAAAATSGDLSDGSPVPTANPVAAAPWSVPEELALAPPQLTRGRLVVYAEPWGNVWINGKPVGRSPLRERLKPGLYTVQIGDTYPEASQRVRVSSGKTREITIRREALQ